MSEVSQSPLSRHAGLFAVAAGVVIVIADLVMWTTFDLADHVGTSTDPIYQLSGYAYFLGFCLLLIALVAVYGRQAEQAGRFGLVAVCVAITGTMFLGGDLWWEAFAVTWLAGGLPGVFELAPAGPLVIGAIASYFLFALGWVLFGIASLRARVFPRPISVALIVGGVAGWSALIPPWGVPLGLAVAWLGIWLMRPEQAPAAVAEPLAP